MTHIHALHPTPSRSEIAHLQRSRLGASGVFDKIGALISKVASLVAQIFYLVLTPFYYLLSSSQRATPPAGKPVASVSATSLRASPNDLFLNFYKGVGKNSDGRSLFEILNWDDGTLESDHRFIQWLFPSHNKSQFNASAPTFDARIFEAFQIDPIYKTNLRTAFARLLRFYGLSYDPTTFAIKREGNFSLRSNIWLTPNNHNFLRITRILSCLNAVGLDQELEAFIQILKDIKAKEGNWIISDETFAIWKRAAQ